MTPEQIASYRTLLANSLSQRGEKDPERYIFLRGWNAGLQHADEMLDKVLKAPGSLPSPSGSQPL